MLIEEEYYSAHVTGHRDRNNITNTTRADTA